MYKRTQGTALAYQERLRRPLNSKALRLLQNIPIRQGGSLLAFFFPVIRLAGYLCTCVV